MYKRNRIYISDEQQAQIKETRILIAGAGLGSSIAECALRLGFEHLTICDFDQVEHSNLNRQNYTNAQIGELKSKAIHERLSAINPQANIQCHNVFLSPDNFDIYLQDCDIAINTIDFTSDSPFAFDDKCLQYNIPILHPFNMGWAGCIFVVTKDSMRISEMVTDYQQAELILVDHVIKEQSKKQNVSWLREVLTAYGKEERTLPPPQLAPASSYNAGACASLIYQIVTKQPVKHFPDYYFLSTIQ
ncbi:ThiF family adenylyltransferase [Marinilabiliaceae bacterium JC017]|nr:ThiF family adenylyltransferase [Marinilabiliaceae bacterium JC017]